MKLAAVAVPPARAVASGTPNGIDPAHRQRTVVRPEADPAT